MLVNIGSERINRWTIGKLTESEDPGLKLNSTQGRPGNRDPTGVTAKAVFAPSRHSLRRDVLISDCVYSVQGRILTYLTTFLTNKVCSFP